VKREEIALLIRPAHPDDSPQLAHIQVDSFRTAYAHVFPADYLSQFSYEEQEQDWRDLLAAPTSDFLLVAENESGEILGYALGRPGLSPDTLGYEGELVSLHVRQSLHRQGVGRALVKAVAGRFKELGASSMMLWVLADNPACHFYEKLGGRLLPEQKAWGGNAEYGLRVVEVAYGWSDWGVLALPNKKGK
jgi:ribosomal protein S18 acetylase RimI-like enzyme